MKIRTKIDLKIDIFAIFGGTHFLATVWQSSRRTAFAFTNLCIDLLDLSASLVNTDSSYLIFSTCHSLLPLTCSMCSLEFRERCGASVFLVLHLLPLGRRQLNTDQVYARDSVQLANSTQLSGKSKRWSYSFPTKLTRGAYPPLFVQLFAISLIKVFGIHTLFQRGWLERYVPVVGAIFPVSLLVCGMITPVCQSFRVFPKQQVTWHTRSSQGTPRFKVLSASRRISS